MEYVAIRLFTFFVRLIPWRLLPLKTAPVAFLLHRIFQYRRKVIYSNLALALPDRSSEHDQIAASCYRNLAAITMETFKGYSSPIDRIRAHCSIENPELINELVQQSRSVLIAANHFGNFEFAALTIPGTIRVPTIGIWKPFKNKQISDFIHRNRIKGGMTLIPAKGAINNLTEKGRDQPHVSFFLADQSPSNEEKAHWVTFLGVDTAFIPGVEVVARKLDSSVVYAAMRRITPGHYTIRYHLLAEHPVSLPEEEITKRYAHMIETDILEDPGSWLWTHKRWKKRRPPVHKDLSVA
ncbi:MAG: lysophospholipid acyltransferase family protein [Saprospiraceae bacterium]|nr:lysophospholipid acyltransferase family protein [Saprospiraceae bacterium]